MSNELNFFIALVQAGTMIGCAALNSFTAVIFYYIGQKPPDLQWRNREKRGDEEHHEKVSFFSSS